MLFIFFIYAYFFGQRVSLVIHHGKYITVDIMTRQAKISLTAGRNNVDNVIS